MFGMILCCILSSHALCIFLCGEPLCVDFLVGVTRAAWEGGAWCSASGNWGTGSGVWAGEARRQVAVGVGRPTGGGRDGGGIGGGLFFVVSYILIDSCHCF